MRFENNTTAWDYIRYGDIPLDGSGDFDSDGQLNVGDFYFVAECIAQGGPNVSATRGCLFADMDLDGDVDFHDFAAFQRAVSNSD